MCLCLVCRKGEIVKDKYSEWYRCNNCNADNTKLVDGILYPLGRRGTLCLLYTPVQDLSVSNYNIGDEIKFLTVHDNEKSDIVIHVDNEENKMIIEDSGTKHIRFIIDYVEIKNAFDDLIPSSKKKYSGWVQRKITFILKSLLRGFFCYLL